MGVLQDNLVLSTELITWISQHKEIQKLTCRALAFRRTLRRRASARHVSFRISLRWLIHIFSSVDKTKLFWICVWGKLGQRNHVIIVTSSFSKSSVFKLFFYDNCRNSRALIGLFLLPISGQTHEFKIMRRVNKCERTIWQFVIVKNKLMSVFNASVLLLAMNFVITLSK